MLRTPLEDHYKLTVNVRPVKIAYLVSEDKPDELTRVLQFACTQWGGIRSVIIPVSADLSARWMFYRFLYSTDPDQFISYVHTDDTAASRRNLRESLSRIFPRRTIEMTFGPQWEQWDQTAHPLSMVTLDDLRQQRSQANMIDGGNKLALPDYQLAGEAVPDWV